MRPTWVKPVYVCEVKYSEWTTDKSLRHPIFLGLRTDKKADDEKNVPVVHAPEQAPEAKEEGGKPIKKTTKKQTSKNTSAKTTKKSKNDTLQPNNILSTSDKKNETVLINNHELKTTNLDKIFWPEEKVTKRDMLNYYYQVTPFMLPYMKDRPQSLNRHPDGINGKSFYQKNMAGKVPDWAKTYNYVSDSVGEEKKYFVCSDEASLFYLAMLGCIEMNPWHSRIQSPENPDWCVIDLDPDDNPFSQVIEAALVVKKVLDAAEIPACCKTSGSTGMHIYIPFGAQYSYEQSKLLAELLVNFVHHEIPSFTSLERSPSKRKGKIYLDFLQNRSTQTIAAPYSLRPKPGATVSTPLHWDEVKEGLSMKSFTIFTMLDRLNEVGDIFQPVLGKGIDLQETLTKINTVFG
jgi:bifunctional non-homologous end joining protein LigD